MTPRILPVTFWKWRRVKYFGKLPIFRKLEGHVSYAQFRASDLNKETGPRKAIRLLGPELLSQF